MRTKILSLVLFTGLLSPLSYAATTVPVADITDDQAKLKVFSDACVAKWVEDGGVNKNNPDFKAFGQRFCGCAGKQMLPILNKENPTVDEMEAAKKQASETCLTESALQQTLNSFGEKDSATEQKIEASCTKTWQLLFPNGMTDPQKQFISYFCHCSASPLVQISKQGKNLTDEQYNTKVSGIAAGCRK